MKYKLKYIFKGSKNVWTETFSSKRKMLEWRKAFKPFVKFKKTI